jgi:hypothetical protein
MREIRLSGSEGGGTKPIASPYPYQIKNGVRYSINDVSFVADTARFAGSKLNMQLSWSSRPALCFRRASRAMKSKKRARQRKLTLVISTMPLLSKPLPCGN